MGPNERVALRYEDAMKRRTERQREHVREKTRRRFLVSMTRYRYNYTAGSVVLHFEQDLSWVIDEFVGARWRREGRSNRPGRAPGPARGQSQELAERFMVLEHGLDRAAAEAAYQLGGVEALFVVLWDEHERIGPRGPEAT